MWISSDENLFIQEFSELWPGKAERVKGRLLRIYIEELKHFPIALVTEALGRLRAEETRSFVPSPRQVLEKTQTLRERNQGSRLVPHRQWLLNRLKMLSEEGARWTSPKGKDCLITADGLTWDEQHGSKALPWGDCTTSDLEQILAHNEQEIRREEMKTWAEWRACGALERIAQDREARGEPTAWLRRYLLARKASPEPKAGFSWLPSSPDTSRPEKSKEGALERDYEACQNGGFQPQREPKAIREILEEEVPF